MNHNFQAVCEHEVLRPLEPLDLRGQEVVSVSIVKGAAPKSPEAAERMDANEKQAILALLDEMEGMPQKSPDDGFSQRDHDQVIYGLKGDK